MCAQKDKWDSAVKQPVSQEILALSYSSGKAFFVMGMPDGHALGGQKCTSRVTKLQAVV